MSDVGSATIKRYGLLNTLGEEAMGPDGLTTALEADFRRYTAGGVIPPSQRFVGIAFPGTLKLDPHGRVTSRFFEESYAERSTVESILLRLGADGTAVGGTQISTDHLQLKTYPSDATVVPGNRLALVLEITPRPGIHVYAPGAMGYRVISLTLAAQPFVRSLPVVFPPSETYHFKPLNERVPVYQKPFRLLLEVIPEVSRDAAAALRGKDALTLSGTLEYQACDDKLCYNPVSLPLSWTLALKPMVAGETGR